MAVLHVNIKTVVTYICNFSLVSVWASSINFYPFIRLRKAIEEVLALLSILLYQQEWS